MTVFAIFKLEKADDSLKLQRKIGRLGCWARKRGMRYQPVKCNIMQILRKRTNKTEAYYTLEGTFLENVDSIKYLGVTVTNDLRWNTHISNMSIKANKTLGFLRRNLYQCPKDVKEAAYIGLLRPMLEYGRCVWDPREWSFREKLKTFRIGQLDL